MKYLSALELSIDLELSADIECFSNNDITNPVAAVALSIGYGQAACDRG